MGLFSWITQDTECSIPASGSVRSTFPVTMTDDKGNKWTENDYEGYGVFDGKDYYELLAEMNGLESNRNAGINLAFAPDSSGKQWFEEGWKKEFKAPNLTEDSNWKWINEVPEDCPDQGYFYEDDDDYDDDDYDDEGNHVDYYDDDDNDPYLGQNTN